MNSNKRHLRVVNMQRFLVSIMLFGAVFFSLTFIWLVNNEGVNASELSKVQVNNQTMWQDSNDNLYTIVYVSEGDTLWGIVSDTYEGNRDIRKVISDTCRINNIGSTIYAGQTLYIPQK